MSATLLDMGSLWLDNDFLADSFLLYQQLVTNVTWDSGLRARQHASFGQPYNYSGITYQPAPFPPVLEALAERLQQRLGYRPNNCLANFYPDGNSTMGFHTDSTKELQPGTGIAIVSLGAERTLSFRRGNDKQVLEHYPLRSGSLLYMTPEMQLEWKHAILPQEGATGRISLTYRCLRTE